ncbi:MAG: tetratricopeptide repeat protein [Acetobacteraceae bacterium]|nr:MAG: tetratricopeptide repeat protein [Acetobacteraceae bacterium]
MQGAVSVAASRQVANADGQAIVWYQRGQEAMPEAGASEVAAYAQALRFFGIAAAKAPEQARFAYKIANIYHLRLRQPAQAHPYYVAAVQAEPAHPQWRNGLGGCLEDLGRDAEALQHYAAAQQAAPEHAVYGANHARCRRKQQAAGAAAPQPSRRPAAAPAATGGPAPAASREREAELRRLLAGSPDHPGHNAALAQCLYEMGRFGEALPYFARARAGDPGNDGYTEAMAACLQQLNRPGQNHGEANDLHQRGLSYEAEPYFLAAVLAEPLYSNWLNNFGVCLSDMQRYREAYDVFVRAYRIDPNNRLYAQNVANMLTNMGRSREAQQILDEAGSYMPEVVPHLGVDSTPQRRFWGSSAAAADAPRQPAQPPPQALPAAPRAAPRPAEAAAAGPAPQRPAAPGIPAAALPAPKPQRPAAAERPQGPARPALPAPNANGRGLFGRWGSTR